MNILTTTEYEKKKIEFLQAHKLDEIRTTEIDKDGTYYKNYFCEDGKVWTEVNRPVYKSVEVEVCKIKTTVEVKLLETEGWNTDDAGSIYCYEKY